MVRPTTNRRPCGTYTTVVRSITRASLGYKSNSWCSNKAFESSSGVFRQLTVRRNHRDASSKATTSVVEIDWDKLVPLASLSKLLASRCRAEAAASLQLRPHPRLLTRPT